jgi:hypothetical protein
LPSAMSCDLAIVHSKIRECNLCGCKSNEKSPLLGGDEKHDKYGGFRPWKYYRKVADGKAKTPEGQYCLICSNVFKALGALAELVSSCIAPCM